MFVTWRYVTLRTFTLHRDALLPFSYPLYPSCGWEKGNASCEGEKSAPVQQKSLGKGTRSEERGAGIISSKRENKEGDLFRCVVEEFLRPATPSA